LTALDHTAVETIQKDQPDWRASQIAEAFAAFQAQEVPTGAEEEWRYVELDFDLDALTLAADGGAPMAPGPFLETALGGAVGKIQIIDGRVVDVALDSADVSVKRLAEVDRIELAAPVDRDKFAAAHLAFATDGAVVSVRPGAVVQAPIVVDIQATQPGTITFPHLEFQVGTNAEAALIVVYRSPDGLEAVAVPDVVLTAEDGAQLRFMSVQGWAETTTGLVHQRLHLGRDATGRIGEVGLGGKVARLDLWVDLEGAGSSAEVVGVYFGEDNQTLDYRMTINHIGRNTTSDVFMKGAVEDYAQSVFTGLLRIEKDAVRSSAFETNRNLVLSEHAKAHSVPNLEILCNDVMCGHGSSVGPLEDEYLYYLQSRGISRARAERMLVRGFFSEVIERLPIDSLAEPIEDAVFRRFTQAQEEGRLS